MHSTNRQIEVPVNDIGLKHFSQLVKHAEKRNVIIALENVRNLNYTDYIFDHIPSPYLGFCYDSGHEHSLHRGVDVLAKFGHRLITTHLHDNYGQEDEHSPLGKGSIDWEDLITRLKTCKPIDTLCLEIEMITQNDSNTFDPLVFLCAAYQDLVERIKNVGFV